MLDTAQSVRNALKTAGLAKSLIRLVEKPPALAAGEQSFGYNQDFFPQPAGLVIKREVPPPVSEPLNGNEAG